MLIPDAYGLRRFIEAVIYRCRLQVEPMHERAHGER